MEDIHDTLAKFVERHLRSQPQAEGFIDAVGKIAPNEPEPIQELRRRLRLLGSEYNTEMAYVKWAAQFVQHYQINSIEQLKSLGETEVTEFLTELAVERNVAAGRQNQAFSALLKLFSQVARKDLRGIDAVRANKRSRDPRSGETRRHHLHESVFAKALARALSRAKITKPVYSHTFRHSFATHMLMDGYDRSAFQDLRSSLLRSSYHQP